MTAAITEASREESTPVYRPNGFLRWLTARFFRHIHVDPQWVEAVRSAAMRGTVVYMMRSLSVVDFLCLDYLTKRFELPLLRFVNDLGLWLWGPFGRLRPKRGETKAASEQAALAKKLRQHQSALLFLRRPPGIGTTSRKGEDPATDLVVTLIAAQRESERPILLVPQTFIWGKIAGQQQRRPWDFLLGPMEWPGRVRSIFRFLIHYRDAVLRTGEPFDLKAFLTANPGLSDTEAAEKVRYAVTRRMERERTLVVGPTKKTPHRLREEIIKSPRLRKDIQEAMRSSNRSETQVVAEVDKELRKLCGTPDIYTLAILHRLLDRVWHKIYDGIDVDEAGLARVREAARHGPLILLPSHKSHVDYLVLSDVFYAHQLSPPLIAAGDNLSFWPLGPILRRGGAFFIRRSFKGKKLYSSVVDTYMRKLLLDGHHIELFIEGGRSRTGKLLPPKFGLLSMLVDACLALKGRRVHFVPISVGYELIVEQQSYVDELAGGDKQKENIGGLLKTPDVLRSRYGRLYIQFGDVMPFEKLLEDSLQAGGSAHREPGELDENERKNLVQRIGHRATYEINRVTVVTPVALIASCLMAHRRRGLGRVQLDEMANMVRDVLRRFDARLAPTIDDPGPINARAIDEAVALLRDGKLVVQHGDGRDAVYTVPEERRLALEYYKNNIVHFFVPSALISTALLVSDDENAVSEHTLRERVRKISRLFKYEFMYRADTDFEKIFDDALEGMLRSGEVERFVDRIRTAEGRPGQRVRVYAAMIRSYFEAYWLGAKALGELPAGGLSRKDFMKKALAVGQRLYLAGEIQDRESISKPKLENALLALKDHGLLKFSEKGNVEADAAAEQRDAFISQLRRYLLD
ncbi:MAG: 1-acyl-sn-glycerol-3-phosphate acyltransferase [Myxococcales bacterium]